MRFSRLIVRLLPLVALVPALTMADNDRNYKITPNFFKAGAKMHIVANMPIVVEDPSVEPMIPLKANTLYLRQKMGPKEYHWFVGQLDPKNLDKVHAFNLKENYLRADEVVGMRFYGSTNSKAFLDENDIYFDREYVYSPRVPRLYFRKNGHWESMKETELPGVITFKPRSQELYLFKDLKATSVTVRMDEVPEQMSPLAQGMYAFVFTAPDFLPFVDAVYVSEGSVVNLQPTMIPIDPSAAKDLDISVHRKDVANATTLEDVEALYDKFTQEMQQKVTLVDTNEFASIYPKIKSPISLSVSGDDKPYYDYQIRFNQKRREALELWRASKLGEAGYVTRDLRHKLDSLEALPITLSVIPSKIETVKLRDEATGESKTMGVRLDFGKANERVDVSWSGNVDGYTPDSLYAVLTSGAKINATLNLANNKPVWIYKDGLLTGRHQYRYTKFNLEIDGQAVATHGGFELPNYIFVETEVQEWLNRPIEAPAKKLSEEPKKDEPKAEDDNLGIVVNMKAPRIIDDKDCGRVALIDSGSFRYYGKVVNMSPFAIQTTEMTQQRFKNVMALLKDSTQRVEDRSTFKDPRKPVHNVSWETASFVCKALGGDLPTEAQWEFAGRADNNEGAIWNLDAEPDAGKYAVYRENSYKLGKHTTAYGPQPVASKKPNDWGIYDMSGNVAEWTKDKYFTFSFWVEASNPTGSLMGYQKVYKGGSWKSDEDDLNLTERDEEDPRYWSDEIGFRCAFPRSLFEGPKTAPVTSDSTATKEK